MRNTLKIAMSFALLLSAGIACDAAEDGAIPPGGGGNNAANGGDNSFNPDACVPHADYFKDSVWPLLASRCAGCHTAGGLAGGTRMVFVANTAPGWLEQNLAAVQAVADIDVGGTPLFLLKPSGQHAEGHTGGAIFAPGTTNYDRLANLAGRLRGEIDTCGRREDGEVVAGACAQVQPGARTLRRLTHAEYANTVRDLLGVEVDADGVFAPGEVIGGFDNNVSLGVSTLLADQYREQAERLGQEAELARVLPCAAGQGGAACAERFVAEFGLKAFRRPLTPADIERYMALYTDAAADEGFEGGVRWIITAMLQSPHFLYRAELGRAEDGAFRLTSWEIASELSYLFWGTMPDEQLREKAASGELYEQSVIEAEARRLIQDPRSDAVVERFVEQWLDTRRLENVARDAQVYPDLTPSIREAMARETALLVGELWRSGGGLSELLLADHTWLNAELAAYYGLPPGAGEARPDGFRRVELGGTGRSGLLTQGGLLTTHALPTSSSPIHRGKLVRERLLCQALPPPPANLDTSPPAVDPMLTTRERYARHASDPACHGCHSLIDPIGFAFERFDGAGRWREDDGGLAIDTRGEIVNSAQTDGAFDGVEELSALLAGSDEVAACYAEEWVRFGFGVHDTLPLDCYVDLVQRDEAAAGGLSGVVLALTRTPHFLRRRGGAAELDAPGAELLPPPGQGGEPDPDPDPDPVNNEPDPDPDPDPDPNNAAPADEVAFELIEQSRWDTGYCADGHVTNNTAVEVTWSVVVEVEGTLVNFWNSRTDADHGAVTFIGEFYNATLAPGQATSFGFCAQL